ncbi:SAM-dependent DNA methyltransferase [Turicibacter bilis]|uniref:site-specific DNA-methyltransferase (adenine-specific) n=1 Tax=Turicibacter bilis TaxID=2735723 RepID=A0ABY5JLJ1_9FIRM|nr:SAM-dependent DNA methyltransferase [Turicibacter bilis]MBS3199523.1 SAM-dependent DNA methyltransferase [Turicibacter bilis]UUF06111.1 SAM-dependent DNA methyltransferase [Turicibacter bilis]
MINYSALQQQIKNLGESEGTPTFLHQFLQIYNIPKATLMRLNITDGVKTDVEVCVTNKLVYMFTLNENLYTRYSALQKRKNTTSKARIVMLMNTREILAFDSKTSDWLSCPIKELYKECDFFYPLMGMERAILNDRKTVDVKIGEKFAQFYNEMLVLNAGKEESLKMLLTALITAFFADSFDIVMQKSIFYWLTKYTKTDGSDVSSFLDDFFRALYEDKEQSDDYIGSKINNTIYGLELSPLELNFNKSTRKILIEISEFDWADVEPEVLGALIQNIAFPEEKAVAYNYTSTANIYKVIGPLFMDDLDTEFEKIKKGQVSGVDFLKKLSRIKVLDPACGTGNFLMISYKELKRLELYVKDYLESQEIPYERKEYVVLENFYGIEANGLASIITRIGLLFSKLKYETADIATLRLPDHNIINNIATDVEWNSFCPKSGYQVFIIGNPSYKGKDLSTKQKNAMGRVFADEIKNGVKIGELDYCTCWFYLASEYIKDSNCAFAFVTTNSLTQGTHVPVLWPMLFNKGICISFAYSAFKWKNGGKNNTAVTVVVIGCRTIMFPHHKTIYRNDLVYDADDISPYLTKGNVIIQKENRAPISKQLPKMIKGNMPYGEALLLTPKEKDELVSIYPESIKFLRRVVGANEFIKGIERWCLWISDNELTEAISIPLIADRIERVREYRLDSKCSAQMKENPHRFREIHIPQKYTLVIPAVSSENREYFQIGYVGRDVVVTNLCFTIYDAEPWVFGIISSKMHNLWARIVCGGLETRPRYSNVLGYNTFPLPELTKEQKQDISKASLQVILERENHSEMTLRDLYNEDTMPQGLKYAHKLLDKVVESCYKKEEFCSDQERLDSMFLLYKTIKEG